VVAKKGKDDKKEKTWTYDFGREVPGKGYYARVSGADTVYRVNARVVETLKREMRDTTVLKFDPEKVKTVKLTGWKQLLGSVQTMVLERKGGTWTRKDNPGFTVDAAKVDSLLSSLSNLHADRFVSAGKGLKLAENAFQVEITLDDKKVLELTVGAVEGNQCYAISNQAKGEVFLVNKEPFEKPRKAPGELSKM
jgi:hypothetical protein